MDTVVDVLRRAKGLLTDPKHWRKGGWAATREGTFSWPTREDAYTFCARGACMRVAGGAMSDTYVRAVAALNSASPSGHILSFNDNAATTHADLIDAFDRAILSLTPQHVHEFNAATHICPCGATANGQPVDYEALAPLADAVAAVLGE